MARISLIIPTHNRAAMLPGAIASARAAGTDVEVIVVDDASTDATPALGRAMPGIMFVRRDRSGGPSAARNAGIARATGEFVGFLDDDDLRLPGSLDRQADLLAANPELGFAYGRVEFGDPERCRPTGATSPAHCPAGDLFMTLLAGNFIHIPAVLVRRRCLDAVGPFDLRIRGTEDWDLWLRLAERYEAGALEQPVAIYREAGSAAASISSNRPGMCRASAFTLAKALGSPRGRAIDPAMRRHLRADYLDMLWEELTRHGRTALAARGYRRAAECYLTALRLHPQRAWRPAAAVNLIGDVLATARRRG